MPFTPAEALKIFLSYTKEDSKIAEALAWTLRKSFLESVEITMMEEFQSGMNWRKLIIDSTNRADILVAIATGQLKPSFSFTGMEIGSFLNSINGRIQMERFPQLTRRMIPIAILAKVPDTVNDFEGVDIDPKSVLDIRFDQDKLAETINSEDDLQNASLIDDKFEKLLYDIEDLRLGRNPEPFSKTTTKILKDRTAILDENAKELGSKLISLLRNKEKISNMPKAKVVIRSAGGQIIDRQYLNGAIISLKGDCSESFGFKDESLPNMGWRTFAAKTDETTALQWQKAFSKLMPLSKSSNFLNDNYILSYNRKKIFRIFVSKYIQYYSNEEEYQFYIVEMLRLKDYGDKQTTKYLKALEVGLGYRFMFLEETSEFSPIVFKTEELGKFADRVSEMIDALNFLLLIQDQYELNESKTIIDIFGTGISDNVDTLRDAWEKDKSKLYLEANSLVAKDLITYEDKRRFVETVTEFCEHNLKGNATYVEAVLEKFRKQPGDLRSLHRQAV